MDWVDLKAEIKAYGQEIGIAKMGFTDAQPLMDHLPRLLSRQKAGYKFAINEGDPGKRISPQLHLPQAKSIIAVAVAYPWQDNEKPDNTGPARGRISVISRGPDYHRVVGEKLQQLKDFIVAKVPQAKVEVFTDTGEILEKAIAVKAGLGWFGHNTLLVTPEFGSWVSLGELLTDLPLPADLPSSDNCGSCQRCVEACPTNALDEDKNLNPDRCLACLTLSKALPPREIRNLMGDTLYGCDICQLACPYNQKIGEINYVEHNCGLEESYPVLMEILHLNNAEYKKRFGHTSGAWRGRTPLQRNAVIAAGKLRDSSAVPALAAILSSDPRPVLRGAAAWALGEIGAEQGRAALVKASATEQDSAVLTEINAALQH
jgi:epoxyqueuosine reductase